MIILSPNVELRKPQSLGTRILITNNTLALQAGTERFVCDLAQTLLRRGFQPTVYSTILGEPAAELMRRSIPVTDDLNTLREPPHLIHGQHHLETMTAITHFPDIPAIYVCHGWLPWEEHPPISPNIRHYVAVDDLCRERLFATTPAPADQISVIYNAVDITRFIRRSALPSQPKSALIFSNQARIDNFGGTIAKACQKAGIEKIDFMGQSSGAVSHQPENILGDYDLVFAKGRSALEAMAIGCAVVVADIDGISSIVGMDNLPRLRRLNFGLRAIQEEPITVDSVLRVLKTYDANNSMKVTDWIRANATLESSVTEWEKVYSQVMTNVDYEVPPRESLLAVSEYLKFISPIVKGKLDAEIRAAQLEGDLINSRQQLAASEALLHESEKTWQSVRRTRGWKVLNMIWSLKQRLSFKRSRRSTNGTL